MRLLGLWLVIFAGTAIAPVTIRAQATKNAEWKPVTGTFVVGPGMFTVGKSTDGLFF